MFGALRPAAESEADHDRRSDPRNANISKAFGGVQALRDVSFSCGKGKVHALLGENRAGKSTLIKVLAGAYRADSGEIVFKGQRHVGFSAREAMANGISIIYQELISRPVHDRRREYFPRPRAAQPARRHRHAADGEDSVELLDQLGVRLSPSAHIGDLTVASQQIVEIAKALSQNADLIVIDEPSAISQAKNSTTCSRLFARWSNRE